MGLMTVKTQAGGRREIFALGKMEEEYSRHRGQPV